MGSSRLAPPPLSAAFRERFLQLAGPGESLTFARFMELALYDPILGYYCHDRQRVGYGEGTDFFTASTSGGLFGELVVAACTCLLGPADPAHYHFVEIGAEDGAGVLRDVAHPFASARVIKVGGAIALDGKCVVFSNELFDAQPFQRFMFRPAGWREIGVRLQGDRLVEIELPPAPTEFLPAHVPAGYVMDIPARARELAREICRPSWHGLFVAFDYGKSWQELVEACPAGTARAYYRHVQSNDLLARPGEQDLTCHVCWDWLADALQENGFKSPQLESQEAFFMHHAAAFIASTMIAEATKYSQRKLALSQLIHPSHLGQKFEVLHATRGV